VRYTKSTISNLNPRQWSIVKRLKNNDLFIVIEAAKNLGGYILLRDTYIKREVSEHLGDTTVYKPLTKLQAVHCQLIVSRKISLFVSKWSNKEKNMDFLSTGEQHFLMESIRKYPDNFAKFRMSLKAHKTPWKMRPIMCCAGTMLNNLSRWLDTWLQKLRPLILSYIKGSGKLLDLLKDLGPLPSNAKLFTANANSMYTNINTTHALEAISTWLKRLGDQLPDGFPLGAVIDAMQIVMRNNLQHTLPPIAGHSHRHIISLYMGNGLLRHT